MSKVRNALLLFQNAGISHFSMLRKVRPVGVSGGVGVYRTSLHNGGQVVSGKTEVS